MAKANVLPERLQPRNDDLTVRNAGKIYYESHEFNI